MSTALLVLTLNEIDGINQIMPKIDKNWVDEIIIVDGGSTDGTVEKAKEMGFAESNPVSDLSGKDSADKLRILSSLAFNKSISNNKILGIK